MRIFTLPGEAREIATAGAVTAFLRAVGRRAATSDILVAAGAAAVINEVFRWGTIGVLVAMRRVTPTLDVGPIIFAVLAVAAIRRWGPMAAARRSDMQLGLSDRLTSFLDFKGRDDVPGEMRGAQARETERALDGVRPASVVPIRFWLAAGPLLLAASLIYPTFLFTETETTTMRLLNRIGPASDLGGGEQPVAGIPDQGQRPETAREDTGPPQPGSEVTPDKREAALTQAEPGPASAAKPVDGPRGEGPLPAPQDEMADRRSPDHGNAVEPGQLVSERVGQALVRVVDPVYRPEGEKAQPPGATGSVSINLVPQSRPGRKGNTPGEGPAAERVTVDLDALPEEYRPLVKTYFELLAAGAPAVSGATTHSARSEKP